MDLTDNLGEGQHGGHVIPDGPAIASGLRDHLRNYVRVVVVATVEAADVAEALSLAWQVFRKAAGDDLPGWDTAAASAEVRPW
jgi:hypothetical protein